MGKTDSCVLSFFVFDDDRPRRGIGAIRTGKKCQLHARAGAPISLRLRPSFLFDTVNDGTGIGIGSRMSGGLIANSKSVVA